MIENISIKFIQWRRGDALTLGWKRRASLWGSISQMTTSLGMGWLRRTSSGCDQVYCPMLRSAVHLRASKITPLKATLSFRRRHVSAFYPECSPRARRRRPRPHLLDIQEILTNTGNINNARACFIQLDVMKNVEECLFMDYVQRKFWIF